MAQTVGHEVAAIERSARRVKRNLTFRCARGLQEMKKARRIHTSAGSSLKLFALDRLDVRRLQALRTALHLELDLLAFFERFEAAHLDRGVMREQIFAAFRWGDEAEAFRVVEPLDGASCHVRLLPMLNAATIPGATKPGMTIKEVN
jgi:hypothetical protein